MHIIVNDNEVNGKEKYEPEKILEAKKGEDGLLRYYVKWKGYPDFENT